MPVRFGVSGCCWLVTKSCYPPPGSRPRNCRTVAVESNMRSNTVGGSVAGTLVAASAGIDSLVVAVQHGGLRGEGHDELSALLGQVRAAQARLEFVLLATVREVDVRGSYVAEGALTAGAWARMHTRMTPAEAASVVRAARVLGSGELPATSDALAAGQISPAHVRAI